MSKLFICEYCGNPFYDYESHERKCCSERCAIANRTYGYNEKSDELLPVDTYIKKEKYIEEETYIDMKAKCSAITEEEYDDMYGFKNGDLTNLGRRDDVYNSMKKHKESIIVLYECSHDDGRTKHRHHPNYDKPLEVELLCTHCHHEKHKRERRRFIYTKKMKHTDESVAI
jgi:hypothetical protein